MHISYNFVSPTYSSRAITPLLTQLINHINFFLSHLIQCMVHDMHHIFRLSTPYPYQQFWLTQYFMAFLQPTSLLAKYQPNLLQQQRHPFTLVRLSASQNYW